MKQYIDLLQTIMDKGVDQEDRTGVGTKMIFGHQMRFDLSERFPVLTTKKIHFKSVVAELLWFLSGNTNVEFLHKYNVKIWDYWADKNGNLGPIYGAQWRSWLGKDDETIDQISLLLKSLKEDPASRRHIVTAWNPAEIEYMALPPCHCLFQFHVHNGKLSCQLYQRSGDVFLGIPFNIASYALLTHLIARELNLEVGEFIHVLGDAHIYNNHIEQVREQISRKPVTSSTAKLLISSKAKDIFNLNVEDISLMDYNPLPFIKAPIAV